MRLFLGIIGHRFGAGPKGDKESYTQREYRAALAAGKPRLLFFAPKDFPLPANIEETATKKRAQKKFRKELLTNGDRIASTGFKSAPDLVIQIQTAIRNWEREEPARPVDPKPYLESLLEESRYIDIKNLIVKQNKVYRFDTDKLYTPLTTVLASEGPGDRKGAKAFAAGQERSVPLEKALEHQRVVLVGNPGAGKTTFLCLIAFRACSALLDGKEGTFPIYLRANQLEGYIQRLASQPGCRIVSFR